MLKDTQSWLCGSTNTIVTQQKEVDILVNVRFSSSSCCLMCAQYCYHHQVENGTMEFRDPKLERIAGLTPADRKWMDDIVRDVNDTFVEDPTKPLDMQCVVLFLSAGMTTHPFQLQGQ